MNYTTPNQLRGVIGWILVAAWILFWWHNADAHRAIALAQPCEESLSNNVGDFFFGQGSSCRNSIEGDFRAAIFWACVSAPLMFLAAHPMAVMAIAAMKAQAEREEAALDVRRRVAEETKIAAITDRNRVEQETARTNSDRFEIITRLGAVDDQLVVLENEANAENVKLIKLNIGQSIRDIHAKFKDEELAALYGSDEGLRQRVDRTLVEMKRLGLSASRFHSELTSLFGVPSDA